MLLVLLKKRIVEKRYCHRALKLFIFLYKESAKLSYGIVQQWDMSRLGRATYPYLLCLDVLLDTKT
jgi:hypothetical protein